MDIRYFMDTLWDLINESDELDVRDIQSDDEENRFIVTVQDASSFVVQISEGKT